MFKNPGELIFEKPDRGFMNDEWLYLYVLPHTRVTNLGRVYSNHFRYCLNVFTKNISLIVLISFLDVGS